MKLVVKKKGATQTIERALAILDCFLEDKQEWTLHEIAEKTSLSPSTVYRSLNTMICKAYLIKKGNKKYSLGPKIATLGTKCTEIKYNRLIDAALPYMVQLNKKYDESISLYVLEGEHMLCVECIETMRALKQNAHRGDYVSLISSASGKLLLAHAPVHLQNKVIGDNLFLWSTMEHIQADGYMCSADKKDEGVSCIAVPIRNKREQVVASLAMSGLFTRFCGFDLEEKKIDTLLMAKKATEALCK